MIPVEMLLDKGASERKLQLGEILFEEGDPVVYYYQVLSGTMRWSNFTSEGEEILHELVQPNESVGELPVIGEGLHTATAIAEVPTVLLRLSVLGFQQLLEENNKVQMDVMKALVRQLRFKCFLTNLLSKNKPTTILLKLINYFNDQHKYICEDCTRLMLTRQQLANMTGLRVETIIRALKQMERDEQIHIVKGKVFVPADGIGS